MWTRIFTSTAVAVISCLTVLVVGMWLGSHPKYLPRPIANALLGEDRRIVLEGLDAVHESYYREIPRDQLSDAALKGVVAELDARFSAYFSPKEYAQFNRAINNQFSGVGIAVRGVDAGLRIETVYEKSPAEKAGIEIGDVIVAANNRKLGGLTEAAATAIIKGREGTRVTLRLRRGKRTLVKRVTRATISIPVVESKIANAGGERVAYIALSTFGPSTAHEQMAAAIRKQRRRGAKGIVFDLRGNGGALDITVGRYFLPSGRNLGGADIKTGAGIKPSVVVRDNPDTEPGDESLVKALDVLAGKLETR